VFKVEATSPRDALKRRRLGIDRVEHALLGIPSARIRGPRGKVATGDDGPVATAELTAGRARTGQGDSLRAVPSIRRYGAFRLREHGTPQLSVRGEICEVRGDLGWGSLERLFEQGGPTVKRLGFGSSAGASLQGQLG
jgi:hypothetical protein